MAFGSQVTGFMRALLRRKQVEEELDEEAPVLPGDGRRQESPGRNGLLKRPIGRHVSNLEG